MSTQGLVTLFWFERMLAADAIAVGRTLTWTRLYRYGTALAGDFRAKTLRRKARRNIDSSRLGRPTSNRICGGQQKHQTGSSADADSHTKISSTSKLN